MNITPQLTVLLFGWVVLWYSVHAWEVAGARWTDLSMELSKLGASFPV